jgi:hypothetical protein
MIAALLGLAFLPARWSSASAQDAPKAPAAEAPAENVGDPVAKIAVERFQREMQDPNPKLRVEGVARLGRVMHPTAAAELWTVATGEDVNAVRVAAFKALGTQKTSAKVYGPKLSKWLSEAAEENRKKKARGDYGLRVDPKTNKTDLESPEGKAALQVKRERGALLAEALRAFDAFGIRDKDSVEMLLEFLSDGNDDLVAHVVSMFGKWKEWSVLRELLDLYEYYPSEDKVNVGSASVDTGSAGSGDQQAAKRNWMAKYGDPDRRRPRPPVVRALKKALTDITGETFATPDELREYLRRPEVKRKVR